MTVVGAFYLAIFVAATFVKLPIQVSMSEDVLGHVPPGDEVFRLLEDTWVMFGLELGVIGLALIIGSRVPERARLPNLLAQPSGVVVLFCAQSLAVG